MGSQASRGNQINGHNTTVGLSFQFQLLRQPMIQSAVRY